MAVISTLAEKVPPMASGPTVQVTVPPAATQAPGVIVPATAPAGSVRVRVAPVAGEGPRLVTVAAWVNVMPGSVRAGLALIARARSVTEVMAVIAVTELFAGFGSVMDDETSAVLVNVPEVAVTVTPMAMLGAMPTGSAASCRSRRRCSGRRASRCRWRS